MRLAAGAVRAGLVALTVSGALAACGSQASPTPEPTGSTATERPSGGGRASAADVATGLRVIKALAETVGDELGSDEPAAKIAQEGIEPAWRRIQGSVQANDPTAHRTLEDEFALLGSAVDGGDVTKAKVSSETVAHAVEAYLARFPMDGSTASPSATASSLDQRGPVD